jgi:hypothetical protein
MLKDFTYIDFERVRSYLAQMNGKLQDYASVTTQHAAGGEAGAKAEGLTKLFLDAEAKGSYMYTKSKSETSSLHHAIFDEFDRQVQGKGLVGSLTDEKPFTRLTCHIKVVDYRLLAEQFRSAAKLMPLVNKFANQVSSSKQKQNEKAQVKQVEDIATAIELMFGEVRVLQLLDESSQIIAQAFLNEELLPQKSVLFARNNEVLPEEWIVFCLKPLRQTAIPAPAYVGDDFADKLQAATDALKVMKQVIMPDKNTPTIVPVAIYRSLL